MKYVFRVEVEVGPMRGSDLPADWAGAYDLEIDDMDYGSGEEGYPGNDELESIRATGCIFYGPFNGYGPEAYQLQ
jgi:hypothetical protein